MLSFCDTAMQPEQAAAILVTSGSWEWIGVFCGTQIPQLGFVRLRSERIEIRSFVFGE